MRNLFFVPGGVFDILKKRNDIKTVLVMNEILYKRNESYFKKEASNAVIEIVESEYKNPPKTILQHIFVFFYSYLVFTETTRLISSKGARADIVAAGGRSYLYFLKWLNYIIFGKMRFLKTWFVPRAYFHVFKDRPYKYLFDKYMPDLVFLPNVAHSPDLELLAEAKRQKIKTVGMCGSWDHFNKYFVPLRADILLAWNEPLKNEALEFEAYKKENIRMVGFPQFDAYLNDSLYESREEYLKSKGFPPDCKIIFFASEGAYSLDGPDIIDMMTKWIENGDLPKNSRIILRFYPGVKTEEEAYRNFLNHPLVYIDRVDNWSYRENFIAFINTLRNADIIISTYSTISVEAVVFDRPLININFDGYHNRLPDESVKRLEYFSHFIHVSGTGALSNVNSEAELKSALSLYLASPDTLHREREALQRKMCFRLDGKSSLRIVEAVLDYLYA